MTGRQLRNLRKRLGWTQEKAAEVCGVTVRTWARWEAGDHRVPESVARLLEMEGKVK